VIAMISRFFNPIQRNPSKEDAKKRLKLLLIHDQIELSPTELDNLKSEILDVIRKYLHVNEKQSLFRLDRADSKITLVSSIPVSKPAERIENIIS